MLSISPIVTALHRSAWGIVDLLIKSGANLLDRVAPTVLTAASTAEKKKADGDNKGAAVETDASTTSTDAATTSTDVDEDAAATTTTADKADTKNEDQVKSEACGSSCKWYVLVDGFSSN